MSPIPSGVRGLTHGHGPVSQRTPPTGPSGKASAPPQTLRPSPTAPTVARSRQAGRLEYVNEPHAFGCGARFVEEPLLTRLGRGGAAAPNRPLRRALFERSELRSHVIWCGSEGTRRAAHGREWFSALLPKQKGLVARGRNPAYKKRETWIPALVFTRTSLQGSDGNNLFPSRCLVPSLFEAPVDKIPVRPTR